MAASEAYGNWGDFWSLAKLDFVIHGTLQNQPAKIYANGRNMVEAIITVQVLDKNSKPVDITGDELKKQLYFCHFETGEKLDAPWLISDQPNEYLTGPMSVPSDTSKNVSKYISCAKHDLDGLPEKIAVGINVPGVGEFDTSRYGTSTKSRSGSTFKSPQSAEILAMRPIDYSIHTNLHMECSGFESLKSDLKWVSRLTTEGPLKEHWDGKCNRRFVSIRPNKNATGHDKFKKHEVTYDPIKNADVSTGTIWWWWGTDTEACFHVMNEADFYGAGLPGAVIGSEADNKFRLNLWYSRQNHVRLDGKFIIVDNDYYYRFNDNGAVIDYDHFGDDENGAASLVLYQLVMPEPYTRHWHWKNVIHEFTVKVTDFYGNEGSFQLIFNDGDHFDEPSYK